jgi:hypothetical protein
MKREATNLRRSFRFASLQYQIHESAPGVGGRGGGGGGDDVSPSPSEAATTNPHDNDEQPSSPSTKHGSTRKSRRHTGHKAPSAKVRCLCSHASMQLEWKQCSHRALLLHATVSPATYCPKQMAHVPDASRHDAGSAAALSSSLEDLYCRMPGTGTRIVASGWSWSLSRHSWLSPTLAPVGFGG